VSTRRLGREQEAGDDGSRTEYLRARAIGKLVAAAREVFCEHYDEIMAGRFERDLVPSSRFAPQLEAIARVSREHIYATPSVLQIEAAGFEILGGLLGNIVPALAKPLEERSAADRKIAQIIPAQFGRGATVYGRLLGATDFISGMTDTYALRLFRRLHGIELPGTLL
jgi:dGTPase